VPECLFTLAGFSGGEMPDMTEEEYDALDEPPSMISHYKK
jgi:hypothetical protein